MQCWRSRAAVVVLCLGSEGTLEWMSWQLLRLMKAARRVVKRNNHVILDAGIRSNKQRMAS